MCGITGMILTPPTSGSSEVLRKMTKAVQRRGPDDEGYFESFYNNNSCYVGLGHARLSIIDLASGHQPLSNEDGSLQIVFNGEIYNYQELRTELVKKGHRFSTASDTETIIHAYEEFGDNCVNFLRGMFAFAIWDHKNEKLFLARDRFGKKPLFLYQDNRQFLFASEIKSILECPGLKISPDLEAVWQYFTYRYVPGPATLFSGIRKLLPGTHATWKEGRLQEYCYYVPPDHAPISKKTMSADPIGTFSKLLEEAIRIRMICDVPFGAFLSGGIDSSTIVALMSQQSNFPVKTFSVGFEEEGYSEIHFARIVAQHFHTDHHELVLSHSHLMDELPEVIGFRDAPVAEPADIPLYLLSKEARKSVKMVLTGEGSDEILGGYPKHVFERYVPLFQRLPRTIRNRLFEPLVQALPYRFRRIKIAIASMGIECWTERMARWFGALSQADQNELITLRPKFPGESGIPIPYHSENSSLRRILFFDQINWLPDNLLERGDRMTMAASLEARMPFMDHHLAEFVSTLPDTYRIRGFQTKRILREAMRNHLPHAILNRPKVGFRMPINVWFRGQMKDFLCDHLLGPDSATKGYYHSTTLSRLVEEHIKGQQNHEKSLWMLLNLELWHRRYGFTA